ncbi:MAG: mevalonate kinase [Candidatus Syntropharchaeia archaeon]
MVIYSAPGKVYLFGEHAVVYGEPAVASAIDLRIQVSVERSKRPDIRTDTDTVYIDRVIEKMGVDEPLKIEIDSQIPPGSGLGSSAAAVVACIACINDEFGMGLGKREIAKLGHEIEKDVQGIASPTDTYVSTFGGMVLVPDFKSIPPLDCGIVIGDTFTFASTKKLVEKVADLKKRHEKIVSYIMRAIGELSRIAEPLLYSKDYKKIGELMNINQGLLDSLGVSTEKLWKLINAARKNAWGAKITGAGGGGCIVALVDETKKNVVIEEIERAGGRGISTRVGEGVRKE